MGTDLPPALFRRMSPKETLLMSRLEEETIAMVAILLLFGYDIDRSAIRKSVLTAYFWFSRTLPKNTMNRCAAVKKRGSVDPCSATALRGHTLCGRHARMRSPVIWIDVAKTQASAVVKIQACVRGWLIRKRISYAGFGVLCRKDLANDEDIITCAEKGKVHPMDFFSFEENGKFWWFEFGSLWTWSVRSIDPVNPYTKVPLSPETRKRLRTIWGYKRRHRETLPIEPDDINERLRYRANILIQHFDDYGFIGVHPSFLLRCSRPEFITLFVLLRRDIETMIPASDPFRSRVALLCTSRTNPSYPAQTSVYLLNCFSALLYIITLYREPYVITFSMLSAFYRA